MNSEQLHKIQQALENKNYTQINTEDPDTLDCLIHFANNLSPNSNNLIFVKHLFLAFGLPIMIELKNFYSKITEQQTLELQPDLQALAYYAGEMVEKQKLKTIDFIFQWGMVNKKSKKRRLSEQQLEFVKNILKLEEFREKLEKQQKISAQLESFTNQIFQQYKNKLFLSQAFQKYFNTILPPPSNHQKFQVKQSVVISNNSQSFQLNQSSTVILTPPQMIARDKNDLNKTQLFQLSSSTEPTFFQDQNTTEGDFTPLSLDSSSRNQSTILQEQSFKKTKEQNINLENPICCRQYFTEDEELQENDSYDQVFMKALQKTSQFNKLKEIMCSLLNSDGGNIFIGIKKNKGGKRIIEGSELSENQKQNIQTNFRHAAECIEPDIITHKMYSIDFVPVQNGKTNKFIPGLFVIKVNIRYGIRDDIYSYKENGREYFPFRNGSQIIHKEGRILLKVLKQRIKNTPPIPNPIHPGRCKPPYLGEQIHDDGGFQVFMKKMDKPTFKQKEQLQPFYPIQKSETPKSPEGKSNISPIFIRNTGPVTYDKPFESKFDKILPDNIDSQQFPATKKQNSTNGYFFVIGINEAQLKPLLEKKNIFNLLTITSAKKSRLIIRTPNLEITSKLAKILNKLQEKYTNKFIRYYKINLEIQVGSMMRAQTFLSGLREKCKFLPNNRIRFKTEKDSLEAFLLLDNQAQQVIFVD